METETQMQDFWKKCSSCKKAISFRTKYWVCNVSTCTRKRTGLAFCTVSCWDAHVPMMNHKDAWAEERMSPSREAYAIERQGAEAPVDRSIPNERQGAEAPVDRSFHEMAPQPASHPETSKKENHMENTEQTTSAQATETGATEKEILIVASKLKAYIKESSGMNTAGNVLETLSDRVRTLCDQAINNAKSAGRKTVMDRDFT